MTQEGPGLTVECQLLTPPTETHTHFLFMIIFLTSQGRQIRGLSYRHPSYRCDTLSRLDGQL